MAIKIRLFALRFFKAKIKLYIQKIFNWADPYCPFCSKQMSYYGKIHNQSPIEWYCYEDKISYFQTKRLQRYLQFEGKIYSEKQFEKVVKLKTFL